MKCSSAVTSCQNNYTHQSPVGCTGFPLPLNQLADLTDNPTVSSIQEISPSNLESW